MVIIRVLGLFYTRLVSFSRLVHVRSLLVPVADGIAQPLGFQNLNSDKDVFVRADKKLKKRQGKVVSLVGIQCNTHRNNWQCLEKGACIL